MALDKDELAKLSPQERLKRLKEIEEQRKKEATEIESLIKKSETELKTQALAQKVAPAQKQVDISELFGSEEPSAQEQAQKKQDEQLEQVKYQSSGGYSAYTEVRNSYQATSNQEVLKNVGVISKKPEESQYKRTGIN